MLSGVFKPISRDTPLMNPLFADSGDGLERHRHYLMLLARVHLHSRHPAKFDSSDIVQQTLLDAFAKRDQFRGTTEAELAVWLREILKHNLADAIRDQKRAKRDIRRECPIEAGIDESFTRTHFCLEAIQSSPSQRAVKQENLFRLTDALAKLSEPQRESIVLHHLQGMKLAEVAAETGRTEAAVAGLLFRGLRALKCVFNDDGSSPGRSHRDRTNGTID
jgi:RNA polymerase sigma-70 factor (ECF subfamily)